ncbi:helix-turn-helix domain-containing protein [Streptomyces sp. 3MP-14]|uniref:Helix-turn-helix domain-containing protein n=1 Tax=Streptomyces mimosae TaxID=2586635 RepID=A0A5N6AGV1_9ACTN|nr:MULTISPECIES: helix-turn-helix transcriptional regulator [Streptomyces]KAB8167039.1 helix-turn-helix domain-containing protein [Streptomyces mimosae]KAB8176980.1 helix-turn-helix domain-containing protein [Streptomyces sp. 3MP-14]
MTRERNTPTRAELFGRYVAEAARAAGYDIDSPRGGGKKKLAEDAGMSHASVSRMLAGQTIPDPRFFEPLAEALHLQLTDVLVRSGLISDDGLGPSSPPRPTRPLTPREAAAALGITDPKNIDAFETMAEFILQTDRKPNQATQRGVA